MFLCIKFMVHFLKARVTETAALSLTTKTQISFYYVHTGLKPDPHSGQIMIVNNAPRKALTKNKNKTPWKENTWHQVKVVRDSKAGTIEIFFDDMEKPYMKVVDKTFGKGKIGIGTFDDINNFDDVKVYGK